MKTLKFNSTLINEIVCGKTFKTWRLFDDKNLDFSDMLQFVNSEDNSIFGYGEILKITIKKIEDIEQADMDGYRQYDSEEELISEFKKYYGNGVTNKSVIKIIEFKYIRENINVNDVVTTTIAGDEIKVYTDGGSRGNPGPSACGFVVFDKDKQVHMDGEYLGITTNNQAEYQGVKKALIYSQKVNASIVHIYMDSLLVVNQMTGVYKIRNKDLWPINQAIQDLIKSFSKVTFTHIPREMNKLADAKVNEILDNQQIDDNQPKLL